MNEPMNDSPDGMMKKKKQQGSISRNVILTGLTSFFTDVSSEMIYPLLQAFVFSILATKRALIGPILGIIEGIAESTASIFKMFSSYYSDKMEKRKLPAILGYTTSALSKLLLLLSSLGWYFLLISRFLDRIGKGVRTAPRDALISESTPKESKGKAFGFHRGMDFAGATLGCVLAYVLVLNFMDSNAKTLTNVALNMQSFNTIFLISIIPAFAGILFLFFLKEVKNPKKGAIKVRPKPNLDIRRYNINLKIFFIAQFTFTLGNSSNQFLLLRSMTLGQDLSTVIIMYLGFNLLSTLLSTHFGSLSDKIGRKKVLLLGYGVYSLVYLAFGFVGVQTSFLLWILWPLYGLYYAMTEGVEKAFVTDIAPENSKATALGFYNTIVGLALLPASIIAGILFSFAPSAPFVFSSILTVCSILIISFFVKEEVGK